MIEKAIGKRIQEYRKKKKITQEQLAEKIGVSTGYISTIECGTNGVTVENLVHIMNHIECTADDIFCDVVDKSYVARASKLSEMIEKLSPEEQARIFEVVEVLVKTANK